MGVDTRTNEQVVLPTFDDFFRDTFIQVARAAALVSRDPGVGQELAHEARTQGSGGIGMKQDEDLRTRMARAAERLPLDAEGSLARFHAARSRRTVARRAVTVAFALLVGILALSVAWIARPGGSPRT